ncbi:MAG: phage/plasmid primase, P4 family [archaeon]
MSERTELSFKCRKYFNDKGSFEVKIVGDELLKKYYFKTIKGTDEIYFFENGIYKKSGKPLIEEETNSLLDYKVKNNYVAEVIGYIRRSTFSDPNEIKSNKNLFNLKNCLFDFESFTVQPHDPEYFIISQLPVEYDAEASCPKIIKFIEEVVGESNVPLIQEIIGYCLLRDYPIQKAIIFYGDESAGKSTLLKLIGSFLGQENISGVSLHELHKDRFSKVDFYGKLANIFADLSKEAVSDSTDFKMLTGGDLMTGQRKFGQRFTFHNYAKLIFSANKLPESSDKSGAFFRRWILVYFPNKFQGTKEKVDLIKELTSPEELSGLFNWAAQGLKRLLDQGGFSDSKTTEEIKEEYLGETSSIFNFKEDCVRENINTYEIKEKVYEEYVLYCNEREIIPRHYNPFCQEFPKFVNVKPAQKVLGTKAPRVWEGIELKKRGENKIINWI